MKAIDVGKDVAIAKAKALIDKAAPKSVLTQKSRYISIADSNKSVNATDLIEEYLFKIWRSD